VIAEGVERREQMQLIRSLNCDELQGNIISLPLPSDEIFDLFKKEMTRKYKHSLKKKEQAIIPATRILNFIADNKFSACSERITVSIGIASVPHPSIHTIDKFIHTADLALYEAKAKGRNRVEAA
jgi:GGDEF domain-containing protein